MLGLFGSLKANVPIGKKIGAPNTEGPVALLHYRVTTVLFLGCCILVTSLEWIGNGKSITCAMEGKVDDWKIPKGVIDTYCYIMSTFILPTKSASIPARSVGQTNFGGLFSQSDPMRNLGPVRPGEEVHKAYYQWVSFMLFLQAILFYAPHLIYKTLEGGKVSGIICGLNAIILDKDSRTSKEKALARYLLDNNHQHRAWGIKLFLVKFLYLANIFFNLFLMDLFLQWEFSTYGMQVVELMEDDNLDRIDPMSRIFPKVTKCTFRKFGPTGTLQIHDAICVLPINIINEKIYVFLWFWLLILALVTIMSVVYNVVLLLTPNLRNMMLRNKTGNQKDTVVALETITRRADFGDWTLMYFLSKNMDSMVWSELITELYNQIKEKKNKGEKSERGKSYSPLDERSCSSASSVIEDEKSVRSRSGQKC